MNQCKVLAKQISTLNTNGIKLEINIQEKGQEMIVLKDNVASSNSHLASLQNNVTTLKTERDELATEHDELVSKLEQSLNKISSLEATLSEKEERTQKPEKATITNVYIYIVRVKQLKEEQVNSTQKCRI